MSHAISLRKKRSGRHATKWLNPWSEWRTTHECADSCDKETLEQTRTLTCNPSNICKLPARKEYSGGIIDGGFIWYCNGQAGCLGNIATQTRGISFDVACPCETCMGM